MSGCYLLLTLPSLLSPSPSPHRDRLLGNAHAHSPPPPPSLGLIPSPRRAPELCACRQASVGCCHDGPAPPAPTPPVPPSTLGRDGEGRKRLRGADMHSASQVEQDMHCHTPAPFHPTLHTYPHLGELSCRPSASASWEQRAAQARSPETKRAGRRNLEI